MGNRKIEFVTQEEANKIVISSLRAHSPQREESLVEVIEWAERVRCDAALLDLALEGRIGLYSDDGEIVAAAIKADDESPE